jgi:hypothetical protein
VRPAIADPVSVGQISPGPHPGINGPDAAPRLPVMSIAHADSDTGPPRTSGEANQNERRAGGGGMQGRVAQ